MCCAFRPLQHSQWTQNDVTSQAFSNEKHAALDTGTRTLFCCLFAFMLFGLFRFFRVFVFFFLFVLSDTTEEKVVSYRSLTTVEPVRKKVMVFV